MAFPTVPTVAGGRVLFTNAVGASGTRTFPNLSSLTKNAGDLLIAIVYGYQSSAAAGSVWSGWGGGFTEFLDVGSTLGSIGAAYKISTGSETGTFTVTQAATVTGGASMVLMSIPGAWGQAAPEATAIATGTGAGINAVSLSPSWGSADTLWINVGGSGETSATGAWGGMTSAATNYTDYADAATADTSTIGECEIAVAFRQNAASSEDAGAMTYDTSNTRNVALTIAVRPAQVFTKTQSAHARIQATVTKTQSATGRVQKTVTKTQSAIAQIAKTFTKTQGALARIAKTGTKTQPANARIQKTVTKTQTATANIQAPGSVLTKTQSAIARIQKTFTKTQAAIAKIASQYSPVTSVIDNFNRSNGAIDGSTCSDTVHQWSSQRINGGGTGINISSNEIVSGGTGDGYITTAFNPDCEVFLTVNTAPTNGHYIFLFARADTTHAGSDLQGYGAIWINGTGWQIRRYDSGGSNVLDSIAGSVSAGDVIWFECQGSDFTIYQDTGDGFALVLTTSDATYNNSGYIGLEFDNGSYDDFGGGSRSTTPTKTQTATARIQATGTKTQSAVARIQITTTKTQSAIARVQKVITKTQSALARISATGTKTQSATARIQKTVTKTQAAIARIQKTGTKTQPAIARIALTGTKNQTANARIAITPTKTQPAAARIQATVTKAQTATAKIQAPGVSSFTQSATARIVKTLTHDQAATARIQITALKTQPATSRISITATKTQPATARVQISGQFTQPGTARVEATLLFTQPARARIFNPSAMIPGLAQGGDTAKAHAISATQATGAASGGDRARSYAYGGDRRSL